MKNSFWFEYHWDLYRGEYKTLKKENLLLIISIVNFIVSLTNLYLHLTN